MKFSLNSFNSKLKTRDLILIDLVTLANRYFLVSNAIACSYAAGSLAYSMAALSIKHNAALVIIFLDILIMALLFSANGASAAVGFIGQHGNSHVQWNKVCDLFENYCHQMAAALVLSLLGAFAFIWLVVLAVLALRKK